MIRNQEAVNSLYRQRNRFIIIGLTGRTGAGCTTVSKILSSESIQKLDLKAYKTHDFKSADERKYSVVYRFMKEENRWKSFNVIEASSVIFSYILEQSFSELWEFVERLSKEGRINGLDNLRLRLEEFFDSKDNAEVRLADTILNSNEQQAFDSIINKNDNDQEKDISTLESKIVLFDTILKQKKNHFREILQYFIIEKDSKQDGTKEIFNLYTYFMQTAGNNIRSSGKYNSSERIAGKEISIAQRIDQIIKYINCYEEKMHPKEERVRICIDALRNSMEIQYFRDKYRSFYCIAVNTEDYYRIRRIGTNSLQIKSQG